MSVKNYLLQGVSFCLILSLSGFQSDKKTNGDLESLPASSLQTLSRSVLAPIVVDVSSNRSSYPSMEEEMRMYIQLKKKSPIVYLFPNPSTGLVWMEHNLKGIVKLTVRNNEGKTILNLKNQEAKKLDFSSYESGTYTMVVENDNYSVKRPLIVK